MQMWPMLCDLRNASSRMTDADVDAAVDASAVRSRRAARALTSPSSPPPTACIDGLSYETKCAEAGVRIMRVFRQFPDAERWLDVVSAARNLE